MAAAYPIVSREGWVFIGTVAVVAGLLHLFASPYAALPLWVLVLVLSFLFRDPAREIPSSPLAVVSPADGHVLAVEETDDPYMNRPSLRIAIRMSWWGLYGVRSPIEGKVMQRWLARPQRDGQHAAAEQLATWIQTDEEDDVVLEMARDGVLNVPHCYVHAGERVGQGQRCGFIRFGAMINVYVPANSRVHSQVGDKLLAGSAVIATLVHK